MIRNDVPNKKFANQYQFVVLESCLKQKELVHSTSTISWVAMSQGLFSLFWAQSAMQKWYFAEIEFASNFLHRNGAGLRFSVLLYSCLWFLWVNQMVCSIITRHRFTLGLHVPLRTFPPATNSTWCGSTTLYTHSLDYLPNVCIPTATFQCQENTACSFAKQLACIF